MANATHPELLTLTGAEVNRDTEGTPGGGTCLGGRAMDWMRVCVLEQGLSLELKGIQVTPGILASTMVRETLGYEGTPEELLEQIQRYTRRVMLERVEENFGNVSESDTHATIQGVEVAKFAADDQPYLELLHVGHISTDHQESDWSAEHIDGHKVPLETCVLCGGPCVGRYWIECTNGHLAAVNQEQKKKFTPSQIETLENGAGYMGCYPIGMGCAQHLPKRFYWIEPQKELLVEECEQDESQNETEVQTVTPVSE